MHWALHDMLRQLSAPMVSPPDCVRWMDGPAAGWGQAGVMGCRCVGRGCRKGRHRPVPWLAGSTPTGCEPAISRSESGLCTSVARMMSDWDCARGLQGATVSAATVVGRERFACICRRDGRADKANCLLLAASSGSIRSYSREVCT